MRNLYKSLLAIALTLVVGFVVSGSALAATDPFQQVCQEKSASSSTVCTSDTGQNPLVGPGGLLGKITLIVAVISGAVAVIIILVAGFSFITSGGDPAKVASARNTILYAAIGLVVIIAGQSIIQFVINRL